jgi:hypothetical protein
MAAGLASPVGWPTLPEFRKKPQPDNFRNFPRGRPLSPRAHAPLMSALGQKRTSIEALFNSCNERRPGSDWHVRFGSRHLLYPQKRTLIEAARMCAVPKADIRSLLAALRDN